MNMCNKQKGFSLISIIVYTALATLLISLLMRTSIQFYPQLSGCGKSATEYLKICAAVDRIAHDIYSAPHDITQWKDVESGKIKFKQGEKTVGWYCKNKKLIRLERIFEKQKKNWKKKAKSVAADSVDNIIFNVHTLGSYVTGLTITLESKHAGNPICINRIIAVRTGVDR